MKDDYSLHAYRTLIRLAQQKGYRFSPFHLNGSTSNRIIYLRHDVDYSLRIAVQMAQTNASLGVRGTFFVLLRSQIYNVLSPWSIALLHRIHAYHQRIALHAVLPTTRPGLSWKKELKRDFEILRSNFPHLSRAFSWHMPTPQLLKDTAGTYQSSGLFNTYSDAFTKRASYFSDSNMRWPPNTFRELLNSNRPRLQLLFHPLIWVCGGSSMQQVFRKAWPTIIREREIEFRLNRLYRTWLPRGMDEKLLMRFASDWFRHSSKK